MPKAQILVPSVRLGDAVGAHTFQLLRVLRQRYDEVTILANYPSGPLPADAEGAVRQVAAHHREDADLTIVQYPLWFPLAERVRDVGGARIFWYHGVTPPELWGSQSDLDLLRDSQVRTALAWHTHLAVAASPFTVQELHQSCDFPMDRARVAPLGIDTDAFSAAPDADELAGIRRKWNLDGQQVLLFIGRVAGNKRIDLLIDAVARLRAQFPALKLLIVGDNQYNDAAQELSQTLTQQVEARGLGGQVIFTGRVDAIIPYLHAADIFLLPSQHEGFGVPLVEAMAAGIPVIASASGAMPWVLKGSCTESHRVDAEGHSGLLEAHERGGEDGNAAGLVFAPGDVDDLARQITRLLSDDAFARSLAAQGKIRARDFSLDVFADNVWGVVDEAVALVAKGTPFDAMLGQTLYPQADIAIHGYRVRSNAPLVGPLIEWTRTNMTSHLKEPYIDEIVARQVRYNQMLAGELDYLHAQMRQLEAQIKRMQRVPNEHHDGL